jgi:hypothetical protein
MATKSTPQEIESERVLITRQELIKRWGLSLATFKRVEPKLGLRRVTICDRLVTYHLDQVREIEKGGR